MIVPVAIEVLDVMLMVALALALFLVVMSIALFLVGLVVMNMCMAEDGPPVMLNLEIVI